MRVARAVALFVALGIPASVVGTVAACGVPVKVCDASKIVGLDGGAAPPACATCMQDRCCDEVGRCQDGPCAGALSSVYDCVQQAGGERATAEEAACTSSFANNAEAKSAYTCMRDRCGAECALPVCRVDPAAVLFASPSCDQCVTGRCCPEINACYQDRTCKLTMECILRRCVDELGVDLGERAPPDVDAAGRLACSGVQLPLEIASSCIGGCIRDFATVGGGLKIDPNDRGPCLAFHVYGCAIKAGCAQDCTAAPDASTADASP